MRSIGRGLVDFVFSLTIILVLYGFFARHWIVNLDEARKVTLENQLTNLKYSLELYRLLEGGYPKDLRTLSEKYITLKEDSLYGKKYLELQLRDKEGYPVDPYGRGFIYDNKTGIIKGRER